MAQAPGTEISLTLRTGKFIQMKSVVFLFIALSCAVPEPAIASSNPALPASDVQNERAAAGADDTSSLRMDLSKRQLAFKDGLSVGDRGLFGYHQNELVSIYRDGGLPSGIQHTLEVIVSGKGDNRSYRGQTVAYFEYRDRDDVTPSTKGVGYAAHFSVAPRQGRNNVPYDDVTGIAIGNTSGITSAKATDAIYVSENPLFTAARTAEWYSLLTMDAKADVGIQIKQRPLTGKVARFPNNSFEAFRSSDGASDLNAIGVDGRNSLVLAGAGVTSVEIGAPVRSLPRPVTAPIRGRDYRVAEGDHKLTFNVPCVVTLPPVSASIGRELWLRSVGGSVRSSAPNVVPLAGGRPQAAILSDKGKWVLLYSDGNFWQIQAAN